MVLSLNKIDDKAELYHQLIAGSNNTPNAHFLATIICSFIDGASALPKKLGLDDGELNRLLGHYFPSAADFLPELSGEGIDVMRQEEFDELFNLLISHRTKQSEYETLIAKIVTSACMGADHLWQDLGLWSRKDLTELMRVNFQVLAEKNSKNMKWKRFLYKQLCDAEGIYVCRSPSCEVCTDYQVCFAPEE